jgi:nitrogen fixation NifU-like protein
MDELRELYQEIILDHNKNPKNFKNLESPSHSSEGYNPLCGDKLHLEVKVENGTITDLGFLGSGCAISKASASVMTTMVKGKSVDEVEELFKNFQQLVTGDFKDEVDVAAFGKLAAFSGVREFPTRVKCATLAWHTLVAALHEDCDTVSTE